MESVSFLPTTLQEMHEAGWERPDFVYVTGDAYVDHPSFGVALLSRVLEHNGYRVAILSQPDWRNETDFKRFGKPRLGFLVTSGNVDSMVNHYTVAKKRRHNDMYAPGGKAGFRPDRAVIVYCNCIRRAYGDVPIVIGGIEASLRRFAHYDYWDNAVRRSILVDSRADILSYGMGERSLVRIANLLDRGIPVKKIRDVRGTVVLMERESLPNDALFVGEYDTLKVDKAAYAKAFKCQYDNMDAVTGKILAEGYDHKVLVQNPPSPPLEQNELDEVYALPFARTYHPSYEAAGGVPAIQEVRFSITHNRGCYGSCAFCALAFHQGRQVRARSVDSVLQEAKLLTEMSDFKGYIHDVGGPTANFRGPACTRQLTQGVCKNRRCLTPTPCPNLKIDHKEYADMLLKIEALPKVKKVFVRSGIRYDYLVYDKNPAFFRQLVARHVSGQLKVAPEHADPRVLTLMGKPSISLYEKFRIKYFEYCKEIGKEQYLVPYLMSGHPGSDREAAKNLSRCLADWGYTPEQVQDFYPTPGTVSTCMYYTGVDPFTGKKVFIPDWEEKSYQRALLQPKKTQYKKLIQNKKTVNNSVKSSSSSFKHKSSLKKKR